VGGRNQTQPDLSLFIPYKKFVVAEEKGCWLRLVAAGYTVALGMWG
jgi:hypothetical protein